MKAIFSKFFQWYKHDRVAMEAARGGKNVKKWAMVAVARKLSVLLYRLWVAKDKYPPFYYMNKKAA